MGGVRQVLHPFDHCFSVYFPSSSSNTQNIASSSTCAKLATIGRKTPDKRTGGKRKTYASLLDLDNKIEEIMMEED